MSLHVNVFPEPNLIATVTDVQGTPVITLAWGPGYRDHVALFLGDSLNPNARDIAAAQLDAIAAAVLTARQTLGELPEPGPITPRDHELLTVAELAAVGVTVDPTDDDDDDDEPAATSPSGFATLQHAQAARDDEPTVSLTLDRWGRVKSVTLVRLADGSTRELADGESWPADAYDPMTVNYQQAHPMTEGERAEAWGK